MKTAAALLLLTLACGHGQTSPKEDVAAQAKKDVLTNAASAGTPLPATINVSDNVNVEAVMLPRDITRRVFGKEVSDNYAVIEVNISNRSNDAALIVQSLFIDLRDWGLAGPMGAGLTGGANRAQPKPWQAKASPLEVSSVEYRIVRGELLDRQPWTKRNVALRTIQVLGTLGTAFAFPFTRDVVTGIGAWNGAVVPGFQTLFPDGLQAQLDRISDYGFRNNKVIPQKAADLLVAFFPIRRFLTPGLQEVFLNNPALFFNPMLMVLDPSTRKLLNPTLLNVFHTKEEIEKEFTALLNAYGQLDQVAYAKDRELLQEQQSNVAETRTAVAQDQAAVKQDRDSSIDSLVLEKHTKALESDQAELEKYKALRDQDQAAVNLAMHPLTSSRLYNMLSTLSLNNVNIVVSGIMTVDIDSVPAVITSLVCANDNQPPLIWADAGDRTCAIHGSFLTGGTPVIAEAAALGITVGPVPAGSTDAVLNLKLTLTKPVPPKTTLTLQVSKKNKQGNTVESMKFAYSVPDYALPAPSISSVAVKDTTVTVAGANFYDTSTSPLAVIAHPVIPAGLADQKIAQPVRTLTQIQFDDKAFAPACWQVQVKVGSAAAPASTDKPPKEQFPIAPTPKIDSATLTGTKLTVTGDQLVDLAECGSPLTFEVLSDAAGAKPQAIAKPALAADAKQATFDMPVLATGAKWKEVHALLQGKQAATTAVVAK